MLQLVIPAREFWDERINEFVTVKGGTLSLEHSLVSVSKWEAKWHKSFLSKQKKTFDEVLDYVRCMTLTQNVDPNLYALLTQDNIDAINKYIEDPMTATQFLDSGSETKKNDKITAELIYYWMISLGIPFECQKWHLNRLLSLIRVCNRKNQKPKKMSTREIMSRNSALNASRRKSLGSKG